MAQLTVTSGGPPEKLLLSFSVTVCSAHLEILVPERNAFTKGCNNDSTELNVKTAIRPLQASQVSESTSIYKELWFWLG